MADPSSILIRVDASKTIGAGHVMRCLALAQAWLDTAGPVTFACAEISEELSDRLVEEGVIIAKVSSRPGSIEDARETLVLADQSNSTAIVVDGYHFDQDYHDTNCEFDGVTLTLDDYGHLTSYNSSFVLNQNLGANVSLYENRADRTQLILGPDYALIRREFQQAESRWRDRNGTVSRVLVTFGGSDPNNVTEKVIRALLLLDRKELCFRVIVGPMYAHFAQLSELLADKHQFQLLASVRDMAVQYAWADLAISAGGSSNWEMCCFGLPRVLLITADNQIDVVANLELHKMAASLGNSAAVDSICIARELELVMRNYSQLQEQVTNVRSLVDGFGAERVCNALRARC